MGMRIPSVRDATGSSDGSGRGTSSAPAPCIILPIAQNPLPLLLIYRATSRDSAGVDGAPAKRLPSFSVDEGGRPSRRSAIGHDKDISRGGPFVQYRVPAQNKEQA